MTKPSYASLRNQGTRILAKGESVSNDSFCTRRNNNDLIIGPTGAGKTRYYVKPNLLQASESLIITDTKGSLYEEVGPALHEAGYRVLLLDLTNPRRSIGYNPFDFIHCDEVTGRYDQKDIATMAEILYGGQSNRQDPYWDDAAKGVLRSLIACLLEGTRKKDHRIKNLIRLLEKIQAGGEGAKKSEYEKLMEKLRHDDPQSYAAAQYYLALNERVARTAGSVKMILGAQLSQYDSEEIACILDQKTRLNIRSIAKRKTALFVTISDMDRAHDKLANLFYAQALQELCRYADQECRDHCLPIPVRFILDDFATNARIPDFDKHISVIRSRGIAVSIILQSLTQLDGMYGEAAARTIVNGCDTILYLGGQDLSTANYIGTRTDLPDYDILTMPLDRAWLLLRGEKPRLVRRYELTEHPRYSCLGEKNGDAAAGGAQDRLDKKLEMAG